MRKILRASVMALALCCPAFAGDTLCPPVAPPPPSQPATAVEGPTAGVEIQSPEATFGEVPDGAAVTFWEVALNLLALS